MQDVIKEFEDARSNKRVIYLFDIYDIVASFKMQDAIEELVNHLFDIYDIVALLKMQGATKELLIYSISMI